METLVDGRIRPCGPDGRRHHPGQSRFGQFWNVWRSGLENLDGVVHARSLVLNFDSMEVLTMEMARSGRPLYGFCLARSGTHTAGVSDAHGYRAEKTSLCLCGPLRSSATDQRRAGIGHGQPCRWSQGPRHRGPERLRVGPGSTISGPTTIDVKVYAPSWMQIDQLDLLMNGDVIDTVSVTEEDEPVERLITSFELNPELDAHYVLMAQQ